MYNKNAEVSDYLNDILLNVDLMNKDFWTFRYFGKDHIDMKSFFQEFENVLRYVFNYYGTLADRKSMNMREVDFNHSVYMKCVDIATGLYYGSLMCNHYTDQFATYNNRQNNIGYVVVFL